MRDVSGNRWYPYLLLALYVGVYVVAVPLHHHGTGAAGKVAVRDVDSRLRATDGTVSEEDDEHACLLCSVLHQAQIPIAIPDVENFVGPVGEESAATTLVQPRLVEKANRS